MMVETADEFFNAWDNGAQQFTIRSSGSTGTPKTILLERKWMIWSALQTQKHLHIQSSDAIFCCLPIHKVGGLMMLCRSKVWGCKIQVATPSSNPLMEAVNASIISLTPYQLFHVWKEPISKAHLLHFKVVLIGGGPIDPLLEKQIKQVPDTCRFFHSYGMTETYSHIALRALNGPEYSAYYTSFDDVKITETADACALIQTPFYPDGLLSSDTIELLSNNQFKLIGRRDHVINSGGFKFAPEQIEQLIYSHLEIDYPICISAMYDEALGEKIVLVTEKGHEIPQTDWHFLDQISPYCYPKKMVKMAELPYNEGGKLDRPEIKKRVNTI